jgi:hypothetical protein
MEEWSFRPNGARSHSALLDRLIETYKGKPLEQFFNDLRNEIHADQDTLEDLIEKLGEEESAVRKAGAWVAEKFSRAKIRLSDSEEGQMGLFHALEGLVLGIFGKRGLWTALAAAADTVPQLRELDYGRLIKRASDQCRQSWRDPSKSARSFGWTRSRNAW